MRPRASGAPPALAEGAVLDRVVGGEVWKANPRAKGWRAAGACGTSSRKASTQSLPNVGVDPRREPAVGAGEGGQVERERDRGAVQRFRQSLHDALPEPGLRRGVVDPSDEIEGAQVPIHEASRRSAASMREAWAAILAQVLEGIREATTSFGEKISAAGRSPERRRPQKLGPALANGPRRPIRSRGGAPLIRWVPLRVEPRSRTLGSGSEEHSRPCCLSPPHVRRPYQNDAG